MNRLSSERQTQIASLLVEGCSIRSIERITGTHRDTICRLLVRIGKHCETIIDREVNNLCLESVQVDEIWGYIHKKERRRSNGDPAEWGDCYTYLSICPESKMILSFEVGKRSAETTERFVSDLSRRVVGKTQIATDAFPPYRTSIPRHFGKRAAYMQVIKSYEGDSDQHRYAPPRVRSIEHVWIQGWPEAKLACTSHIERFNWSVRTYLRRLTRLSNGFSRKLENFRAAVAMFIVWYNWCKRHSSLKATPAVAMGLASKAWPVSALIP